MNGQVDVEVDYKRKYKNLKRKLKFLVYVSTVLLSRVITCQVGVRLNSRLFFPGAGMLSGGAEESSKKTS